MHEIPWYVVIDPIQCSVVEVGKSAWRIAVQVDSKQCLVDFEDDLPSPFLSEEVAQIVCKNLGDALAYLRSEEEKQVEGLKPDPQVKKQPCAVSTPPFVPDPQAVGVPQKVIEDAQEEIDYIAMGWLGHLGRGKRVLCLCFSSRQWYVRRLDRLLDYFLDQYQGVPWEIQNAVQQVQDDWAKKERSKTSSF